MVDIDNGDLTAAAAPKKSQEDHVEYAPSTALIMLGSMHFEHAGNADVLLLKIDKPRDCEGTLNDDSNRIAPNSLEALHLVLKAISISSLFDESLLSTFYTDLIAETGEVMVHAVLPESLALMWTPFAWDSSWLD
jgi:hypothetical protein